MVDQTGAGRLVPGPRHSARLCAAFGGCLAALTFPANTAPALPPPVPLAASPAFANATEASLVRALTVMGQPSFKAALSEIDGVLAKNPNFRLGHLIKGDLLMARAGTPVAFANTQASARETAHLKHEARVRIERYLDGPPPGHLPSALLHMAPTQAHALLIDAERHRLYVFRNEAGVPRHVADFYVSAGKNGDDKVKEGDQRTPLGVYHVTSTVPASKLPDFYGPGAFPINYPNEWDRENGRSGSGIWLHGTPSDTYSRPPRASDGCVVLVNEDFVKLTQYVDVGATPVVITNRLAWLTPEAWSTARGHWEAAQQAWRADWESRDIERYLRHYSPRFIADGKDFKAWAARKREVAQGKKFVKVGIENLHAFTYQTASEPYVVVTFIQDYRSNNLSNKMRKRQYWTREGGQWRIIHETSA